MRKYCMRCMRSIEKGDTCSVCGEIQPQRVQPHMIQPGTILKERYLLGNALGQGGFGITYIGCDLLLNMRVAVKEYFPTGYATRNIAESQALMVSNPQHNVFIKDGVEKFLREARVLAEFHDESGVVDVRDFFRENNTAYIVMEYLDGATLQQCIKQKRFAPELIFKLITPVLDSLEKIHEKQVIHRDISPDNIMMMGNGVLKLMDFGAARQVDFSDQKSMSVVLKAGYAPVEQYRPKGELGPWTDIYALCATLYVCITGIHPDNALERVFDDAVKWPTELGIPISKGLQDILKKGMAVNIKERFQNINELRVTIASAINEPALRVQDVGESVTEVVSDTSGGVAALTQLVSEIVRENAKQTFDNFDENLNPSTGGANRVARTVAIVDDDNCVGNQSKPATAIADKQPLGKSAQRSGRKQPMREHPAQHKRISEKDNAPVKKESTTRKSNPKLLRSVFAAVIAVLVVVGIAVGVAGNGKKSNKNGEPPISVPSYITIISDAGTILRDAGITDPVTSLKTDSENYNETYQTYLVVCHADMTSSAGDNANRKVKLVYRLDNGQWNLNTENCTVD